MEIPIMYEKSHLLICVILILAIICTAHAAALAPDDGSIKDSLCLWLRSPDINYDAQAGVWTDVSGKGNDAEAVGYMAVWDNTYFAPTLSFGSNPAVFSRPFGTVKFWGNVDDLMRAANINGGQGLSQLTIIAVYKLSNQDQSGAGMTRPVGIGSFTGEGANLGDYFNLANDVSIRKDNGAITGATATHPDNTFFTRVARMNPASINQWFDTDGTLQQVHTVTGSSFTTSVDNFYLGDLRADNSTGGPSGYSRTDIEIAEVIVYNTDLTDAQIGGITEWLHINVRMERQSAFSPAPQNGALLTETWTVLQWEPGASAVSHNVYIAEERDRVNNATPDDADVFAGSTTVTSLTIGFPGFAYPDGLVPGTTYYWRVDEVNDAAPDSPWKGDIWSFSIAPRTAYSPVPADGAEFVNLGVTLTWTPGFDAKLHTVYFADDFDDVNNATGGLPLGTATYTPTSLESEKVYYWRVDEFDGAATYKGAVWSFTTPGAVGNPKPSNGAASVEMNPMLDWTPADHAASHQVYFGTDKEAVRKADTGSPEYKEPKTVGAEGYDPGLLEPDVTYYWRIDEVNSLDASSPWKGPLWTFTTADFLVIDDFEDYDVGNNEIWWAWKDGLGYAAHGNEPAYAGNGTGSAVGDETTPSYTEETIVHTGRQSMPLAYDNNKDGYAKYSEVELTLTSPRDWTVKGVDELALWFRGSPANSAVRLYVAIADSTGSAAVVYNDDLNAALKGKWIQWVIPLQSFADQGVNLANVDKLVIGLGTRGNQTTSGGSGKMYFDDIRLDRSKTP
jgi:hypothetical protein